MNRYLLIAGGAGNFLFAAFHLTFPFLFGWEEDFGAVSSANRAILYTAHAAVILILFMFAYVSIFHPRELLGTRLGRAMSLSICLFWLLRTASEIVYFRIGVDGAWWRVLLFFALAAVYIPAFVARRPAETAFQERISRP